MVDVLQGGQLALFINMGGRSSILGLINEVESFYSGFGAVISYGTEIKKENNTENELSWTSKGY